MKCRDNRVRIEPNILADINQELENEIKKELTPNPTQSLIINVALLKYIGLRDNSEIKIGLKNDKIVYQIK